MTRRIVTYGGYFERFMETLSAKQQQKIKYGLLLLKTQDRLPAKFVKFIRDGLYELRTKKTQKTPKSEIDKALQIKEAYYGDK